MGPNLEGLRALAADPAGSAQRLAFLPWVAGCAVAGITDGTIEVAAAGIADLEHSTPVEPGTRFRPGSTTKLVTATVAMQCVEAGLCALDDPVVHFVPELDLADSDRMGRVTIRHLLSHSSGIDAGDFFVDTGDDDDCRARYVDALSGTDFLFEPGAYFSYCNAGTILVGRVVEVLRGAPWEAVVQERILDPLGMCDTSFVPGPSPRADADSARGHLVTPTGITPLPSDHIETYTTRAMAPAGGTLVSTAGDLAKLVVAHAGASSILSPSTAASMRELAMAAPGGVVQMLGVGLGWQTWYGSARAAGANPGQSGVLALADDGRHGVVVLTNSDAGVNAAQAALDPGVPPADTEPALPLDAYTGDYESHVGRLSITIDDGTLTARLAGFEETMALTPVDATTCASPMGPAAFLDRVNGKPTLLRWRMRVAVRV